MVFNSWQFAAFLPVVFAVYWLMPHKYRWMLILCSSYYFYLSAGLKYVVLLIVTTAITYETGIWVERTKEPKKKKAIITISISICLACLAVFKYSNFIVSSISDVFALFSIKFHPTTLKIVLPLGISFYTFNVVSYMVDVYRGRIPAEHHFGVYAAFVAYFPKLISGPIERAKPMLNQLKVEKTFDYKQGLDGSKLFLWGLFKKIVVADTLVIYVDLIFNSITQHSGFALVLAAVFFSIQIYCDFSGYSDMACGVSKLLGIELMENFRSPYFSTSIKEFWSKWHISLSTWFRDYVYIPMGGNRVGKVKRYFNILVTFLASGLWHGANWTYVLWGGLHGIAQITEKQLGIRTVRYKRGATWLFKALVVFIFVTAAWVFFRADSFSNAMYLFANMFAGIASPVEYLKNGFDSIGMTMGGLLDFVIYMLPLTLYDFISVKYERDAGQIISEKSSILSWLFYISIGLVVVFMSQKGVAAQFVYMQF